MRKRTIVLLLIAALIGGVALGNTAGIVIFVIALISLVIIGIKDRYDFTKRYFDE